MTIESNLLIHDLSERLEKATAKVNQLKSMQPKKLNFRKSAETWSALECIEHLNLYGDFYLPEMEKQILSQKKGTASTVFKSGLLGNYFANLMLIKNGKMKKMKTLKDKNPMYTHLSITTIDRFLKQLERLISLLQQAKDINLTRTKSAISLSKYIRLRLGDTLRFVIYHIERHIAQAERSVEAASD
ncbi:MAG: DinB family protein [Chitinophagaceae bacterium]|nr:DinB family protein [Chitinophagaceae bacterium]